MALLRRALWWGVPAALLLAAEYELALALGAVSIGPEPGDGPEGEPVVELAVLIVMLLGIGLAVVSALGTPSPLPVALYAPAAAAFLIARFYTYDPYYAPSLRRYSDDGNIAPALIFVYAVGALAVGEVALVAPRIGGLATAVALFLIAIMTVAIGVGH
jgi:hypothetical protein